MSRAETALTSASIRIHYIRFWPSGRARLDAVVYGLGMEVTSFTPDQASALFDQPPPDLVLVGFATRCRASATFLANFKSSAWFRRIPVVALINSRDENSLWRCIEWGCDDAILKPIRTLNLRARVRLWALRRRQRDREREATDLAMAHANRAAAFAGTIVPLGIAMMAESSLDVLLERILHEARTFCRADGGTIYLVREDRHLEFKVIVNESLGIALASRNGTVESFPPIPIQPTPEGERAHIACHVALTGETVKVDDIYHDARFDATGAREFDRSSGYRTQSLLTIALNDKGGTIIGVLQLVNARDEADGEVTVFSDLDQEFMESLSRLAGQALESYRKMARLRRQANALVVHIDDTEKVRQVESITSSDYFQSLKMRAQALRDTPQPMESTLYK